MQTTMSNFQYYFQIEGSKGGLSSLNCEFSFAPSQGEDIQDVQKAARCLAQKHINLFDCLYSGAISGKRTPVMTDGGLTLEAGYQYSGRVKIKSVSKFTRCLQEIFPEQTIDIREKVSPYSFQSAKVLYSVRDRNPNDAGLEIGARLDHPLSVCLFHFFCNLKGIEAQENARKRMEYLKQILQATKERDGLDYYETLMDKGTIAA